MVWAVAGLSPAFPTSALDSTGCQDCVSQAFLLPTAAKEDWENCWHNPWFKSPPEQRRSFVGRKCRCVCVCVCLARLPLAKHLSQASVSWASHDSLDLIVLALHRAYCKGKW